MRSKLGFRLITAIVAGAALLGGSLAVAQEPGLESKISSAQSEAKLITDRINSQSARLADLEDRAERAAARERELSAQLEQSTARSDELAAELLAAEGELEAVRARYDRAIAVLSERLVAIYKSSDPDYLTIILQADGFEELNSRAAYVDALTDADERIAERVSALNDQVTAAHQRTVDLKAGVDAESRRLDSAREEIASIRAAAEQRAAEIARARSEERAALGELQERISGWELEVRKQAAEELEGAGDAFLGGPYAIPTYIVMCESGGNYRAYNPSSGAGGAYQIIPSTWRAYGGKGLAHQASKAEQDRIAAIIWANDGPGAWSCA